MTHVDLVKIIWHDLYDPEVRVHDTIEKFFHQNFEQCINGVRMNREEYIHHVLEQRKNMSIDAIDYQHILERDNELFALYYPKGRNINNLSIEAEVIAYFRFEDRKIFRIHGQVRLIKGDLSDVDMKDS